MPLVACKECGKAVSDAAKSCVHCGVNLQPSKRWMWIAVPAGVFTTVMLIGMSASNDPQIQAQTRDRDAIKLCWSDYGTKSFDQNTKRFVAQACELLERRFYEKHGFKP